MAPASAAPDSLVIAVARPVPDEVERLSGEARLGHRRRCGGRGEAVRTSRQGQRPARRQCLGDARSFATPRGDHPGVSLWEAPASAGEEAAPLGGGTGSDVMA